MPPETAETSAPRRASWRRGSGEATVADGVAIAVVPAEEAAATASLGSKAAASSAGSSSGRGLAEAVGRTGTEDAAAVVEGEGEGEGEEKGEDEVSVRRKFRRHPASPACLTMAPDLQETTRTRAIARSAQSVSRRARQAPELEGILNKKGPRGQK